MPVVGTRVLVNASFTDTSGALFDPSALSFVCSRVAANGAVMRLEYAYPTDAQIVRTSTGKFYVSLLLNEPGQWRYRWESTALNEESVIEGTVFATAKGF